METKTTRKNSFGHTIPGMVGGRVADLARDKHPFCLRVRSFAKMATACIVSHIRTLLLIRPFFFFGTTYKFVTQKTLGGEEGDLFPVLSNFLMRKSMSVTSN